MALTSFSVSPTLFTMPYFTNFLSFLGLIALGAEARIPSQNLTTGVFLSYNEYNSNAVYEAWKGPGEFSLLFNSRKPTAFLAYQDDSTYNHFDLFLVDGKIRARVTFDECQWKELTVEGNFSDSQWHRVRLTRQPSNVSVTVDGCYSQSIPCRYASSELERWQALYVGSIPWNASIRYSLANPGIFLEAVVFVFQGCIGHVTQTAPGENSRPLALRSSECTGSDCESYCAPGWKCNPIGDVTRKECECPGYGNEKPTCKLHSSKSNDDLTTIIMASSSTLSQSVHMTSNKSTPKLSSAIHPDQTNVEATSSSKITDSATPTSTQSASKHAQDSSGVKAQYVDVAYLDQQSSVPGKSSRPQALGLVSALTSLFTPDGVFPSSVEVQPNSSVDDNGSAMAKKVAIVDSTAGLRFTADSAYAEFTGWSMPEFSELQFYFKTGSNKPAILLYQDNGVDDYLEVSLVKYGHVRLQLRGDGCSKTNLYIRHNFTDNSWHKLKISRHGARLNLSVDNISSEYTTCVQPPRFSERNGKAQGSLFMGGIPIEDPQGTPTKEKWALTWLFLKVLQGSSWFHGCIALLRYSSEAKPFENVKLLGSKGVWENCSGEACSSFEQNKCKHRGICVDLVVKTECDCKGTGYYGRFCERSVNQELTTTSDVRNTALTPAPDHTKPIKDNKNDEKNPGETKGEATARKNKKARNEASCVLVSPGWCLVLCMGSLLMRTATAR